MFVHKCDEADIKENIKTRVTGPFRGNPQVSREFPSKVA